MQYSQQGNPPPNQPQYQPQNNQTVVIQGTQSNQRKTYRLAEKQVLVHGAMQVTIGLLCIIFNIILLAIQRQSSYFRYGTSANAGSGFWCGGFFILTGAFGITASKNKGSCIIITYMVFCIISALLSLSVLGFGSSYVSEGQQEEQYFFGLYFNRRDAVGDAFIGIGAVVLIMAIVELVISIWSSALCCAAVCCCRDTNGVVHNNQPGLQYNPNNQVVYIHTNNPGVMYPNNAGGMYYPQGQTTYINNQGGVPVHMAAAPQQAAPHMAAAPQPAAPPAYNQASAGPPSYNPDHNTAPHPSSGAQMSTNAYPTKDNMSTIGN